MRQGSLKIVVGQRMQQTVIRPQLDRLGFFRHGRTDQDGHFQASQFCEQSPFSDKQFRGQENDGCRVDRLDFMAGHLFAVHLQPVPAVLGIASEEVAQRDIVSDQEYGGRFLDLQNNDPASGGPWLRKDSLRIIEACSL